MTGKNDPLTAVDMALQAEAGERAECDHRKSSLNEGLVEVENLAVAENGSSGVQEVQYCLSRDPEMLRCLKQAPLVSV